MPQFCPRCKRANPNEATYCHFDGNILQMGAVAAPLGQLVREFVFAKSGRRCRTVEDVALSCQTEWSEARDLLQQGEFERYFGQAGRLDLSRTAQEAQETADPDLALLQFINNLPVAANPQAPRVDLTPRRISLGSVKAGEQRQMKVTVLNLGKGLLQGKIAVTDGDPWLKLVDGPNPISYPVTATRDQDVTVRVDSRGLIAGQAYSGRLTVVTNGGIAEVPIRLDVKALGFTRPPFQGATSPRGMAERMRTNPKQAVPLLESGDVQRWFEANGWKYPVAGTPARGIGAVQQFFECLGLSKPPPVALSESEMRFQVIAPAVTSGQVALRTTTKKWVFALVDSDAPWLRPTKASVSGPQQAQIGFEIDPALMDGRPQQEATLRIIANGGKRLAMRVKVSAQFPRDFVPAAPRSAPMVVPVQVVARPSSPVATMPMPAHVLTRPAPAPPPMPASVLTRPAPALPPMPASVATRSGPAAAAIALEPAPLEWLPQTASKPRRSSASVGVRLLRPLVAGIALALMFRLVIAAPAELFARVLASKVQSPAPGSLECWKHSPLERKHDGELREPQFLKWFVLATWWVGGLAGAWLVWRRGGNAVDLLFGTVAGVAGGLPAAATAACAMVVVDGLPRALLNGLSSTSSELSAWSATPLWLALAALCWAALGAGLGYLLCASGRGGARLLEALVSPLAGLCRACGLRGLATLFAQE